MAALLVGLSIMAIMFTVVMPVWKQSVRREKETELVFRGTQYAHAIGMFQRKFANAYPPSIDVLVEQRFLRKKFKDPITNADFVPILVGQGTPGSPQQPGGQRGGAGASSLGGGRGTTQPGSSAAAGNSAAAGDSAAQGAGRSSGPPISSGGTGQTSGGIQGVTSKSKEQSIRLYNGRGHYNEWAFVYIQQQQAPGAAVPGGVPGVGTGRGTGTGTGPGQGRQGPPGAGQGRPNPPGPGGPGRPTGPGGSPAQPILPPSTRGRF